MSENCNHDCAHCEESCESREIVKDSANSASRIGKMIAVVSGKGGVGKSTVTAALAKELRRKGYEVGVLDADLTGPSIPRMLGVQSPAFAEGDMILPNVTPEGIKVVSADMLLENPETPVLWRGPILNGVVRQFFTQTKWGDLDYLLVDMPPGTGDVPLTVFQLFPMDGVLVVTTPQQLVSMIVMKAVNMARQMDVRVIGVIENMSYVLCPDCGRKIEAFGPSSLETLEKEKGLKALDALPLLPETTRLADQGRMFDSGLEFPRTIEALESL